jgi:hypothetical protein
VLWTVEVPSSSVDLNPQKALATLTVDNLVTKDFGTLANSLGHGPSVPVTVSFNIEWTNQMQKVQVQNAAQTFRGEFVEALATITFSAQESGFTLASLPVNAGVGTVFAEVGQEHNGVFYKQPFSS